MKTIIIIFAGLMVQVDQPNTWLDTMVMPDAGNTHVAELAIPIGAINNREALLAGEDRGTHAVISIQSAKVRVRGTRGYRIPRSDAWEQNVPTLRRFGCSTVKQEIRNTTTNGDYAFIQYRGGVELTTYSLLPDKLKFADENDAEGKCRSCSVQWKADLWGDEATFEIKRAGAATRKIEVAAGTEVIVRNVPTSELDSHFYHLYDIYSDCQNPLPPEQTTPCTQRPLCKEGDYEVGSTRPTYPAADCTVTDEP